MDTEDQDINQREATEAIPAMQQDIAAGRFLYGIGIEPEQSGECWDWLMGFINVMYKLIKIRHCTRDLRILITYGPRDGEPS